MLWCDSTSGTPDDRLTAAPASALANRCAWMMVGRKTWAKRTAASV
jgi:hypothetical protein